MTTTKARRARAGVLAVLLAAAFLLACGLLIRDLFNPPPEIAVLPFLGGALFFPVLMLAPNLLWFAAGLAVYFAVPRLLLSEANGEVAYYGCTVAVCAYVAYLIGVGVRGFVTGAIEARRDARSSSPGRRVVALSGYAKSGKDTSAAGLIAQGYTQASFAAKLKEFALAVNPLVSVGPGHPGHDSLALAAGDAKILTTNAYATTTNRPLVGTVYVASNPSRTYYVRLADYVDAHGWTEAKDNPEVRELLQRIGTDAGRRILGEDVWVDAVMGDLPAGDIVFTDARFPNEAAAIAELDGGMVIRVTRPGTAPVNPHPSETALDDWDFDGHLNNSGQNPAAPGEALSTLVGLLERR